MKHLLEYHRISEYHPLNFHYRIGYRFFGSFYTHFLKSGGNGYTCNMENVKDFSYV